jgi:phage-related holin
VIEMAYYDLTGFFWFMFGVIMTLLIILLCRVVINREIIKEEYMNSLDDKQYRKYTKYLRRMNGFEPFKKGGK